jgi:AcrR family transcriptional regulator
VVRAAVALADAGGIESVTMRRLAEELGVVPMALYKHVANKDELLDGMIDVVYSEIEFPSRGTHWKTAMRQRARSMREALLRHSWAIGLMDFRTTPGPANLQHHNAVLERLRGAGFSIRMALHAYGAMNSYIYGSLLQQQSLPFETPEEFAQVAEAAVASNMNTSDRSPAAALPSRCSMVSLQWRRSAPCGCSSDRGRAPRGRWRRRTG